MVHPDTGLLERLFGSEIFLTGPKIYRRSRALENFSPKGSAMSRANLIALCAILLLCCAVMIAQPPATTNPQNGNTAAANPNSGSSGQVSPEQVKRVEETLKEYFTDYRNAQWSYSWAYHICIYGAAILSALSALLSKVHVNAFGLKEPTRRDNLTASFAAIAALLIAISTAGKLQDSWQTNRTKRYAVESLLNQLRTDQNLPSDELEAYGKRLALIIDPNTATVSREK
jgi:hypothetical protein